MKARKYNSLYVIPSAELKPFVIETSGLMGSVALEVVRYAAAHGVGVGSKGAYAFRVQYLRERLAVALWRGNTSMISHWQAVAFKAPVPGAQAGAQAQQAGAAAPVVGVVGG